MHLNEWDDQQRWFALPRRPAPRVVDSRVPDRLATDYQQACLILEDSPKMSAALSRTILADVLEEYGGYDDFKLSSRIDAFIADARNPRHLRENLHHLREMADFGLHTQKDKTDGAVIDVEAHKAEWTLDIVDRLFDYYIVQEARDREIREAFDNKIQRAGRKPIQPLGEDDNGREGRSEDSQRQ